MTLSFEDTMGPVGRRLARFLRACRWGVKGVLGRPRTVLVELNWRLGDEIMALPVLEALHATFPKDMLAVLTQYPELYEDNPAIDAVNPEAVDPDRYLLLRGASRRQYRRAAYSEKCGLPTPATSPKLHYTNWETPMLARLPQGGGPLVALAPGASWPSKRWPTERWNELALRLLGEGHRLVVLGAEGEGLEQGVDLTGQTGIRDAACLLREADLVVGCDSGLMHLALAAGTPTVALFGPTDPAFLIRDDPCFVALCSTDVCHGFWNHAETVEEPGVCPEGHACCLESISVEQVLDAALAALAGRSG